MLFFSGEGGFLALQKSVVIARPVEELTSIDLQDAGGDLAEERPVVRHEQQCGRPVGKECFQPGDRIDVEVVGRLIKEQQIWFGDKRLGQQHSPLHAGRRRFDLQTAIEFHPRQDPLHLVLSFPVRGCPARDRPLPDDVFDGSMQALRNILRQQRRPRARREGNGPAVGLRLTRQNPHERRLARSIPPQQPNPLACFDLARHLVQERRTTKSDCHVADLNKRHR